MGGNCEKKSDRCRLLLHLQYPIFASICQVIAVYGLFSYYVMEFDLNYNTEDLWFEEKTCYQVMLMVFPVGIAFMSFNILETLVESGFYGALHDIPAVSGQCWLNLHHVPYLGDTRRVFVDCDFVYTPLVVMGYITNSVIWAFCLYLNINLTLWTSSPLDLVLSILAVFFIMEIDNMLVPPRIYNEILQWFKDAANVPKMKSPPTSLSKYRFYVVLNTVLSVILVFPFLLYLLAVTLIAVDDVEGFLYLIVLLCIFVMNVIC